MEDANYQEPEQEGILGESYIIEKTLGIGVNCEIK